MGKRQNPNLLSEMGISPALYGIVCLMLLVACSFIKKFWLHWGTSRS